tara:strand:+ start:128 stop:379 length:252 start_codon:yes stop_codon:yes gene_type:complete
MIFITVTQQGYTNTVLHGPFKSVDEGKEKVTDGVDRGNDGDETKYTFFEMTPDGMKEIGYVKLEDECVGFLDNDLKSEVFYNN